MLENHPILAQAESIARDAKRTDMERILKACEQSDDTTLRSLAQTYRMLNFGF